jgi:hypothetical protein
MTDIFNRIVLSGQDIVDILFSITLAAVAGAVISQVYKRTHRGLNYEFTFMATLVLLAPIISVVMLYIRGDLVLSLGLIGSLSIIRFRTPIKDTRDMVFLFWVIAVGLGAGTYNWSIVILSTLFVVLLVSVLYFIRYGNSPNSDFVLILSGSLPYHAEETRKLIQQYVVDARVRSLETSEENWEVVYELRFRDLVDHTSDSMVQELQAQTGVNRVSLLAPQLALPL